MADEYRAMVTVMTPAGFSGALLDAPASEHQTSTPGSPPLYSTTDSGKSIDGAAIKEEYITTGIRLVNWTGRLEGSAARDWLVPTRP